MASEIIPVEGRSVIVLKQDCLALGFCMNQLRAMGRQHGLNFRDFLDNGIEGDELLRLNDANANALVEKALERVSA